MKLRYIIPAKVRGAGLTEPAAKELQILYQGITAEVLRSEKLPEQVVGLVGDVCYNII